MPKPRRDACASGPRCLHALESQQGRRRVHSTVFPLRFLLPLATLFSLNKCLYHAILIMLAIHSARHFAAPSCGSIQRCTGRARTFRRDPHSPEGFPFTGAGRCRCSRASSATPWTRMGSGTRPCNNLKFQHVLREFFQLPICNFVMIYIFCV